MKDQMTIAVELAIKYHEGQEYGDSGLPYIYHLKCVDDLVIAAYAPKDRTHSEPYSKHPGDEMDNLRAVAFLHDILEDTECKIDDLHSAGINDDVIWAVIAITKDYSKSYKDYIVEVRSNDLALKVKLCDTSTNLAHSVLDQNQRRIDKYIKQLNILKGFESL